MTDEPTAKVTLNTVYDEVRQLSRAVTILTERLPAHVETTENRFKDIDVWRADHTKRLRAVEARVWIAVGAFGLMSALAPYLSRAFIS